MHLIVGASAAILCYFGCYYRHIILDGSALDVIGNVVMACYVCYLVIDLMQLRSENMGGHISHLQVNFVWIYFIELLQNGTDLAGCFSVFGFFTKFIPKKKQLHLKVQRNSQK
jgi:hypothetical protein